LKQGFWDKGARIFDEGLSQLKNYGFIDPGILGTCIEQQQAPIFGSA
jgi:hypothetical protein